MLKCRADQHAAEPAICGEHEAPLDLAVFEGDVIDVPTLLSYTPKRDVQERSLLCQDGANVFALLLSRLRQWRRHACVVDVAFLMLRNGQSKQLFALLC